MWKSQIKFPVLSSWLQSVPILAVCGLLVNKPTEGSSLSILAFSLSAWKINFLKSKQTCMWDLHNNFLDIDWEFFSGWMFFFFFVSKCVGPTLGYSWLGQPLWLHLFRLPLLVTVHLPATLLPLQLPAYVPEKAVEDGPSFQAPATHWWDLFGKWTSIINLSFFPSFSLSSFQINKF